MEVLELTNVDQVEKILNDSKYQNRLIVIDCGATWCNPCKIFGKLYYEFVKKYSNTTNVLFCKLDVDKVPDICETNEIRSIPTILFIRNSNILNKLESGDFQKFKNILNMYTVIKQDSSL